ncbi:UDP-N-acetylmuramate--L-alanine ligase [Candidatus Aminicenantes bacterium AC-708-M15]|jgi:UDP-N-acetylmuramate--alanine ligase|nr:UDP-N-acetylmuramate--L-alanine ligase [SCandidatus Aminicenantes bacterium Aminicenantia_JdfR_composite]MCP2597513.1 UDP-N-acetylmuramate--L-alanine ligase [Candidatus Aminicenantes bacterium AC-335-G13]MCP2598400.1 UDP-N-acetylmuramate--L-alanine ligase [Candidatus Aminicenantes bacterium AC-335-L06]MCP2604053.1 UDP-N-acetylmuramate--L-alanine ligase [Candidatus Aminicenantes bacterium AC-708-M15]MCP2606422.1 UDP-N-acetylmuramate--L-alanine ligase [Candidatus Aminicenantes bacterium AC-708
MSANQRRYGKIKNMHFVGIGGEGMCGIAEVMLNLGYKISGSDLRDTEITRRLARLGAKIFKGHKPEHVREADVVIISSAIKEDNIEVKEAKRLNIPVIPRAEMLAELMRMKYGIAVAGSHGKTTTTSMIAHVLEKAEFDPTIILGGRLKTIGANAKLGEGDYIVAEADESDRSFLYLFPYIAVITNVDEEHLDQYGNIEEIKRTFVNFARKVPFYSSVVLCWDDPNTRDLIPFIERRIITYGLSSQADIHAKDIKFEEFGSVSTVYYNNKKVGKLKLNVPGEHNILNALAAIGVGLDLEIPSSIILEALENYPGIGRRFELKAKLNDVLLIDDYAHHPNEIKATLQAAKHECKRRVVVIFQPHRYTRVYYLMEEFADSFDLAEVLIITEIFPAGEKPIEGINGYKLYEEIKKHGHRNVLYEKDLYKIPELLKKIINPGDLIITMGAGNIYRIIPEIIDLMENLR